MDSFHVRAKNTNSMINKLWVNCVNGIRVGHELLNVGVENILVGNGMEAQWGYEKYK